jgi:hypothetical protein
MTMNPPESPPIIYEVNLEVDAEAAQAFAAWLAPHIEEMLALDGFTGARWWARDPAQEPQHQGKALWTVHYHLRDAQAMRRYLEEFAPRMRSDGLRRFQGQFTASRRVLSPYSPEDASA